MNSSNFKFLLERWPALSSLGQLAEEYLYNDPNSSMVKIRQFGETMAQLILAIEHVAEPEDHTQHGRLQLLKQEGILTPDLLTFFHTIKNIGNNAVHGLHNSKSDAQTAISYAFTLSVWFMETYGDWQFKAPAYRPPDPGHSNDVEERIRQITDEYNGKVSSLETQLKELRQRQTTNDERNKRRTQSGKVVAKLLNEAETRRQLIDQQLRAAGWEVDSDHLRYSSGTRPEPGRNIANAEWPTKLPSGKTGRADYVLYVGMKMVGIIEAKKKTKDVLSDLEQAKSYAKGIEHLSDEERIGPWGQYTSPFLFSTNGRPYLQQFETKSGIWFLDARKNTNHPRALRDWYSPQGLAELLNQDEDAAQAKLQTEPLDYLGLRDYQYRAIQSVENALGEDARNILIAMATGTGKTRMAIGLIYRLIKAKRFRRVLFLVDREALGQQAKDAFEESRMEDYNTFTEIFELKGLTEKRPEAETKVHIATVQGMVKRILFSGEDSQVPTVDQYDCIVVDEAHRGYILDKEMSDVEYQFRDQNDYISKYRAVLDHFDAVKIGLTATPALHTTDIFGPPVFTYSYREAVVDGCLVDHDPPHQFETHLKKNGIHWKAREQVATYVVGSSEVRTEWLPENVDIDVEGFNKMVITENFNRVVIEELVKEIDPTLDEKTLVFAATDNHADDVVRIFKEELTKQYGEVDDDAVQKITGSIHNPAQAIKRFKNEKMPNIVVTVDLLTTGVDVPKICNIVFLRRVKSRILYEQMLGRATRLCPEIGKTHFSIYDAVGIYEALESVSTMKPVVVNPSVTFGELVQELQQLDDTKQQQDHIDQFIAKLQRKKKLQNPEQLEQFQALADGRTVDGMIQWLRTTPSSETKRALYDNQRLITFLDEKYSEPSKQYISDHEDQLLGHERGYGKAKRPEDYLDQFAAFIREHMNEIPALQIVCQRPRDLTRQDLRLLQVALAEEAYTEANLRTAWAQANNHEIAADIIGFIRQRAIGSVLVSHEDRIRGAMKKIYELKLWTKPQKQWLERIEKQLLKETVLGPKAEDAFNVAPFIQDGGFRRMNNIFDGELQQVLDQINDALYA
ncbi:type I restriction-modification system endonuclease [Alicyclobacillaceae bacterium I2511]|nr:type I restriction-modification system endonuclease [Alicyclobacillaceae bacterium I2511]